MDQVLKTRAITSIFFVSVVLAMIFSGRIGAMLMLTIATVGASYEFCNMVTASQIKSIFSALISLVFFIIIYLWNPTAVFMSNLAVAVILCQLYLISSMYTDAAGGYESTMPLYPLIYPTMSMAMLFHYFLNQEYYDGWILLSIIILIWVSDSGAYLVGRKLGRRKLFEKISPKKTLEGSLGAGFFTLLAAIFIFFIRQEENILFWLIMGLSTWILGTYGDLVESSIKRRCDVKDSGNIMPGHGGFFDRFDSLIFVAPFVYLILTLLK